MNAHEQLAELEQQRHEITSQHIWRNAMSRGARPKPPDTSELDAQIRSAKEACGKAFWQRTKAEIALTLGMPPEKHRQYIKAAKAAGKAIPAVVLADYPDLQ